MSVTRFYQWMPSHVLLELLCDFRALNTDERLMVIVSLFIVFPYTH